MVLLTACGGTAGSSASCAAPVVSAAPASVAPGGTLTVSGKYFVDGCDDTNDSPPAPPQKRVAVTLTPAGSGPRPLGTVDASGELGVFDVPLRVPVDIETGTATLTVGTADPIAVTIG